MTPKVMRQLWSVVEATQTKTLLQLDDASLVQWLVKQIKTQALLDCHESDFLSDYVKSRLALIRDLAQERQFS
jgi:succinate dehydrogenase flavin-adding protein (antitoxin of CptAB toxin-antitoxin module)